jgi:hypothetical protein
MNKQELVKWVTEEQQKWELILAAIGESRMEESAVNRVGNWNMLDIIAHLCAWQRWLLIRLQTSLSGTEEAIPPWPKELTKEDEINAWIYEANRHRSVGEVLKEANDILELTLAAIQDLPDDIPIETIQGKFHPVIVDEQYFAVGEFFHHFYDDHAADVQAWLERTQDAERK